MSERGSRDGAAPAEPLLCDCCERPLGPATDACPHCGVPFAVPAEPLTDQCENTDLVNRITAIVRQVDEDFQRVGGSSRHWVRDCFLPTLNRLGWMVVQQPYVELLRAQLATQQAAIRELIQEWRGGGRHDGDHYADELARVIGESQDTGCGDELDPFHLEADRKDSES